MENGLLYLHNIMRWVVLLFAILAIFKGVRGMNGGKVFTNADKHSALFLMISADIQLLLGIALYFMKGWANVLVSGSDAMKNPSLRFWTIEHQLGMLIALILIHVNYIAVKKNIDDVSKFKKLFWFSLIALLAILISIPWPFRELVGRPWFPGM